MLRGRATPVVEAAAAALAGLAKDVAAECRFLRQGRGDETLWTQTLALRRDLSRAVADAMNGAISHPPASRALRRAAVHLLAAGATDADLVAAARREGLGEADEGDAGNFAAACLRSAQATRDGLAATLAKLSDADGLAELAVSSHLLADPRAAGQLADAAGGRWLEPASLRAWLAERPETAAGVAAWVAAAGGGRGGCGRTCSTRVLDADPAAAVPILNRGPLPTRTLDRLAGDADGHVRRMAVRRLARRAAERDAAAESALLRRLADGDADLRRAGRAGVAATFEALWRRLDDLTPDRRRSAGRAVLKLLPDAGDRLRRLATGGPADRRLRGAAVRRRFGRRPPPSPPPCWPPAPTPTRGCGARRRCSWPT